MEKLKMHSPNLTQDNIARIRDLFPGCVTEARCEDGSVKLTVDFDLLRQELADSIVEGPQERYHLNWPGKSEALVTANAPINRTLRPIPNESVNFEKTKNIFVEGDNLEGLKLLQETYLGKVKLIYIDPPYNTGSDFIYRDNFTINEKQYQLALKEKDEAGAKLITNSDSSGRYHSNWLSMIFPRLRLAKNLLSEDGAIFISIDDHEVANLRKISDEIFGAENFIAQIIWEKIQTRKNSARFFSESHDYILCYAKNKDVWQRNLIPREGESIYKNPDNDPKGPWKLDRIYANNLYNADYKINNPLTGEIFSRPQGKYWRYSEETINRYIASGQLIFSEKPGAYPNVKRYLSEVQDGLVPTTIFDRDFAGDNGLASRELSSLLEAEKVMDYPKPTKLLKRILQIGSNSGDLVLDFFAGSGSMGDAVMQLNAEDGGQRRFILCQIPEDIPASSDASRFGTIAEIAKERLRRAAKRIVEIEKGADGFDSGFRVLKIDSSNFSEVYYSPDTLDKPNLDMFVDNIKPDRTPEDLLFQVMLDWGVDLALPIAKQAIQGQDVFLVDGNALAACFDAHGGIDEDFVKELAKVQPLRVVFRDAGFKDSSVKINVEQIFKLLSPATEVKCI